jgi:hypothetical protein
VQHMLPTLLITLMIILLCLFALLGQINKSIEEKSTYHIEFRFVNGLFYMLQRSMVKMSSLCVCLLSEAIAEC